LAFVARQAGFAEAVFERIQGDLDLVAYLDFENAFLVVKLFDRNQPLPTSNQR
jgi:hypothetical protein